MSSGSSFAFDHVDRVTVGTVGEPGSRTFFLQARQGEELLTLKVEKQQVQALAAGLGDLLVEHPATEPLPDLDELELVEPVFAEWAVGSMALSFATDREVVLLGCEELLLVEEDSEPEDWPAPATARLVFTRAQAAALATRGTVLLFMGRSPEGP